mmetsp:Transcript_6358/g.16181  ORF Transcript_6358/g.16181 Transcript_6358/m.16181 type:complete len:268 (-) Transcript_6358:201-1004(-)|eukprot:CAMPEP_0197589680 /NCGR_PEP_ID=MMETSP1326-20131121/10546_1 /TAXON_ID=1155430 /ORGANISM="Genus nov. species nov., Strain RCC2288" /LENGTH=267 /DNA_ID=CAMNT_0043154647 /DNA_START=178 /DNA_END=981 /DNA_ORIENTATION=+
MMMMLQHSALGVTTTAAPSSSSSSVRRTASISVLRVRAQRPIRATVVAAAAGSGGEGKGNESPQHGSEAETFQANMLQNVRAKVQGFSTTMAVSKLPTEESLLGARKPASGDLVSIVFSAQTEEGELLQAMEDMEEPLTFEVGGSDVMGNPLFLAFDKAVQGMVVGDSALVSASGGAYDPDLLFKVPLSHPEVLRLQEELDQPGKGGLHAGATVALSNGRAAVIRAVDDEQGTVMIDSNHPFAGADLQFAVKLVSIEDKPDDSDDEE